MLKLFVFSKYHFDNIEKVSALLDCFSNSPFPPTHFDDSEPIQQVLSVAQRYKATEILSGIPEYDGGILFLRSKKPQSTFVVRWIPNLINEWYGEFDCKIFAKDAGEAIINFLTCLFSEFPVVFAGLALTKEWELKHWITEEDDEGGELTTKVGLNLERCLPGIYWITVFGTELVTQFGRDVILSIPCYKTINLGEAGVMLILNENPNWIEQSHHSAQEQEVKRILGQEYFFDISKPDCDCVCIMGVSC